MDEGILEDDNDKIKNSLEPKKKSREDSVSKAVKKETASPGKGAKAETPKSTSKDKSARKDKSKMESLSK